MDRNYVTYQRRSSPSSRRRRQSSYDELNQQNSRRPQRRWPLPIFVTIFFAVVIARLGWLQVVTSGELTQKADSIAHPAITLKAKRGTIYDRNGNILAASVECRTLYSNPSKIKSNEKAIVADILAQHLGGNAHDFMPTLTKDTTFAWVKRQVDTDTVTDILKDLRTHNIDGIYAQQDEKRVYPYGSAAGQVLGFLDTDGKGVTGLEKQYNTDLSGSDGEMRMEQGADGMPIAGGASEIKNATDGTDIVISLDIAIQQKVEEQITLAQKETKAASGNAVVTDPTTGEILALASTPLFDPTNPDQATNESLKLSSISDSFEPGSTFKILTLAIGYDTGVINSSSTLSVPPKVKVGSDLVGDDDKRSTTMLMTPYEIMRRSSNAGAALVGQSIGDDKYAAGLEKFGIGSPTGIDMPSEASGLVTKREDYTGATVGAMSFGQGIAIPSIQLVRAVGAIANKGVLTTPHLLIQKGQDRVSWDTTSQACSEQAAHEVTQDMEGVVKEGTGKKAQISGYSIAGKTGTGQQISQDGGYDQNSYLSSFIGFANADDPKAFVYVGMNGTAQHGGTAGAPYFSAIMNETLHELGIKAQN